MTVPSDFTNLEYKLAVAACAAHVIAGLVPTRGTVVQAGGCAGLWPIALAQYFEQVYTCEPEPTNFQHLRDNIAAYPNISARQVALGDRAGLVGLTRPKARAGLWRVEGEGEIPMVTLDDALGDVPIDAIVLDVEGAEVPTLHGAEHLICTYRPLLWCEFLQHPAAIEDVLADYGYTRPVRGIGEDWYSIHSSRMH